MADDATIPPLPSFLDRKTWKEEQWRKSEETAARVFAKHRAELAELQEKAQKAKEAKKVKEAMDAQRKLEREATEKRREEKRIARNAMLAFIRRALDKGPVTANELRQAVAPEKGGLVPWALRTMLKAGEITKVSRQTYRRVK